MLCHGSCVCILWGVESDGKWFTRAGQKHDAGIWGQMQRKTGIYKKVYIKTSYGILQILNFDWLTGYGM